MSPILMIGLVLCIPTSFAQQENNGTHDENEENVTRDFAAAKRNAARLPERTGEAGFRDLIHLALDRKRQSVEMTRHFGRCKGRCGWACKPCTPFDLGKDVTARKRDDENKRSAHELMALLDERMKDDGFNASGLKNTSAKRNAGLFGVLWKVRKIPKWIARLRKLGKFVGKRQNEQVSTNNRNDDDLKRSAFELMAMLDKRLKDVGFNESAVNSMERTNSSAKRNAGMIEKLGLKKTGSEILNTSSSLFSVAKMLLKFGRQKDEVSVGHQTSSDTAITQKMRETVMALLQRHHQQRDQGSPRRSF